MADPNVDLWAINEVHFQQRGSRCQMWIPPETKDPILLHHPTRRSVGYLGAVRLRDGKFFFHRETGKFNGATFFVFLKALYRASTAGLRRVVVITDYVRYHHARLHRDWREQHADSLEIGYLPPTRQTSTSNGSGDSLVGNASTIDISPCSERSSIP
jgi:hypothetical protein